MHDVAGSPATTRLNPVGAKEMQSLFGERFDVVVHTHAGDEFFVIVALAIGVRICKDDPAGAIAAGGVFGQRIRGRAHRDGDLAPQAPRRAK